MVTADPVPTSARVLRLRKGLRELQVTSGLSPKEIARRMNRSEAAYFRWLTPKGAAGLSWERVLALCTVCGADESTTAYLLGLAQDSEQLLGWVENYGGAPTPWLGTYLGFEAIALRIETYQNAVIPGLFQTPEYARAIIGAVVPRIPTAEIGRRTEIRAGRQMSVLDRDDPPQILAVITEGALRQRVFGNDETRSQLKRLLELAQRPNITLQVHGYECLATPATAGPGITLFTTSDPRDPSIVYSELTNRGLFIEDKEDVSTHSEILEQTRVAALPPDASQARIAQIERDL